MKIYLVIYLVWAVVMVVVPKPPGLNNNSINKQLTN